MSQTQRGSILITIIVAIVLLAVIGVGAVSIMTSTNMSSVAGKETLQASYLAESGRNILLAQTASMQTGAALMTFANTPHKIVVDKTGNGVLPSASALRGHPFAGTITLTMNPFWFRSGSGTSPKLLAATTVFTNQLKKATSPTKHLLAISKRDSVRTTYNFALGTLTVIGLVPDADVYLVGRYTNASLSGETLTVTPETDDFTFFPEFSGVIGIVDGGTSVSKRLTYTKRILNGNSVSFEGVRSTSADIPVTNDDFLGKELALGQYFQVISQASTPNGAKAAAVWGTSGKGSFAVEGENGSGTVGGKESLTAADKTTALENIADVFGGTSNKNTLSGDNITGTVSATNENGSGGSGSSMKNVMFCTPNRSSSPATFLGPDSQRGQYWFAALARTKLRADNLDSTLQVTLTTDKNNSQKNAIFSGLLFRMAYVQNSVLSPTGSLAVSPVYANGLGIGVMTGTIALSPILAAPGVITGYAVDLGKSTANPLLLPYFTGTSSGVTLPATAIEKLGTLTDTTLTLRPTLVLWAYDQNAVRCLAFAQPQNLNPVTYVTLAVNVRHETKDSTTANRIQAWYKQGPSSFTWPAEGGFAPVQWTTLNNLGTESTASIVSTPHATKAANTNVGVFAESMGTTNAAGSAVLMKDFAFTGANTLGGAGGMTLGSFE